MATLPHACPECHATLGAGLVVRNGKFHCPKCDAVVPPKRDDPEEVAPVQKSRSRPIAIRARAKHTTVDGRRPPTRKSNGLAFGLICGGIGLGVLCFVLLCASVVALVLFWPSQRPAVAAAREPEKPPYPTPTAAAPRTEQASTKNDQEVFSRPRSDPQPRPKDPAPPPKEPIQPGSQGESSPSGLGTLPLDELKAASVYVKVKAGNIGASGSGFVVQSQGDVIYVVTNHHVIDPHFEPDETAGAQNPPKNPPQNPFPGLPKQPANPFPGLPTQPGNPFPNMPGPRFPRPRFPFNFDQGSGQPNVVQMAAVEQGQPGLPATTAEVWIVLRSGTLQEELLKVEVVADDKAADLALLKAAGVKNAPQPINWKRKPKVVETLPVVAFGFPFGSSLDPKHKNPAITVTKGNVSALRLDGSELSEVQLDLDINPGNSGGPVVDENGALVGVAVAKIKSTRIGFAIPLRKLERLLEANLEKP